MKVISSRAHTVIGIVVGLLLIVAPWLFGFADEGGAAVIVPVWVGVFILLSELTTTSPYSLVKLVPMPVHITVDVLTGIFLLASPWLFSFTDLAANAWLPHIVVGVLVAGYALMTRVDDQQSSVAL